MRDATENEVIAVLLEIGAEDFLGMWQFVWEAHETVGISDPNQARKKAMELVAYCLGEGLIDPGEPVDLGPGFSPWNLSTSDALVRMKAAWDELDREPITGDVCWFVTTDSGKFWVQKYRQTQRHPAEPLSPA